LVCKKRTLKSLCKILLISTLCVSCISESLFNVQAGRTVTENKQRQEKLKKETALLKKALENAKGKIEEQEKLKLNLEAQIRDIQAQIFRIGDEISQINDQIRISEEKSVQLEIDIQEKKELLKQRLVAIEKAGGDISTIEFLISSPNLEDLFERSKIIKCVTEHDMKLISDLKADIFALEQEQRVLEEKRGEAEDKNNKLKNKNQKLEKYMEATGELLKSLGQMCEQNESQIAENDEEMKQVDAEIEAYYAEQRRLEQIRLAEEARKRAEAEAARKRAETEAARKRAEAEAVKRSTPPGKAKAATHVDPPKEVQENLRPIGANYVWPVPGFRTVTSPFGPRPHIGSGFHGGIDIAGSGVYGKAIVAAASGTVAIASETCCHDYYKERSCGCGGGYGNYVVIDHGAGRSTLYGHMCRLTVRAGTHVDKGQTIGYVGCTGFSMGAHLHFETRRNYGERYNPMSEF